MFFIYFLPFRRGSYDGWTPLLIASQKGHLEVVKALLAIKGIDVDLANKLGETALYFASQEGHLEVVKELLKHGANVNASDNQGWTPLLFAVNRGHSEVAQLLLAKKEINVDLANKWGGTALYIASREGHLEVVKALLAIKGIDVNAGDDDGWTPLLVAVRNGHSEISKLLIEHMLIRNFNETKPDFLSEELSGYWKGFRDKCIAEIEEMKGQRVGNSEISFFDILVADKKKLASYVNDDNIIKVLDTYDYEGNFSVYADKIKSQYTKGMNEKVAADIILNFNEGAINEYTSRMIFNLLDYKEIRNLCKAGYRNLIEKRHTNTEGSPEQHAEDDETVSSRFSGIRIKKPDRCVIL